MIVDTTAGKIEGIEKGAVLQFRGIPYAKAERFRPPEAPDAWSGIRDASRFGPSAPQSPSPTDQLMGRPELVTDEGCLFLNVFTPAADDARRPVMVWIHGGGFTGGSGDLSFYNGTNLARSGDVVVVTINYRLGALGFLQLDGVLDEFAGSAVNGLRDQIAALRWVRDNVAEFGGDPDRVTIFGESAGAMSVATLLACPDADGLFRSAITQSGATDYIMSPEAASVVTERLLDEVGLSPATADRLLDMPSDELLAAQNTVETAFFRARPGPDTPGPRYLQLPFQPPVDGEVVPRHPLDAVRDGSAAGVALVAGTTRDEWNLFMLAEAGRKLTDERLQLRAGRLVGEENAEQALELYRDAKHGASNRALWCAMVSDKLFRIPAIRLVEAQLPNSSQVAMYRFDYASTAFGGLPGACHAIEIPFVFDNMDAGGVEMLLGGIDDGTRLLARRCGQAWLSVARSGQPAHDDLEWPSYETDRRATAILDREPRVEQDPDRELRAFWEAL